jgi:hypothetical protein
VSVDHDRFGGGACDIPRRSSRDRGSSLICEFPAPGTSSRYCRDDDTLICDWGPRQPDDSSVVSLSSSEESFLAGTIKSIVSEWTTTT